MIKKNTVLILGAGASVDYGFPTGRGLLFEICDDLIRDNTRLFKFLSESMGFRPEEIYEFRLAFLSSQAPSVDLFLENRRQFERIGKVAIAANLIGHESFGAFHRTKDNTGWYEFLFADGRRGGHLPRFRVSRGKRQAPLAR